MKKIIVICILLILLLCGCSMKDGTYSGEIDNRFVSYTDGNSGLGYNTIIVDKETKVMYLFHGSVYKGGLTLMVDENGNPLLWTENQ